MRMNCVLNYESSKGDIMKKIAIVITIVMFVQSAQGQIVDSVATDTNQEMYEFLMAKHKKQNKTGLILLGSGLAATGLGILIASNDDSLGSGFTAGALIYSAGVLTTISSIPVLIIAGTNKKKAEIYAQIGQHRMIDFNQDNSKAVAVGLKIQF